jgi:hypothetical protein
MKPSAEADYFTVGAEIVGVVKYFAEFGLFIEFRYEAGGRRWRIDGLLHFGRTPSPERARAYRYDDEVRAVVIEWNVERYRLQVALPADPSWLTATVVGIARGIAADRAFDRLPVLGDALEEAGCTDPAVLGYCRAAEVGANSWLIPLLAGPQNA